MARPRTKNRDAGRYVNDRKPFANSGGTMTAYEQRTNDRDVYVVVSYGWCFPIYVYDYRTHQWYGNAERYSKTTTNHQARARPAADIRWVDAQTMRLLAAYGAAGTVARKLREAT